MSERAEEVTKKSLITSSARRDAAAREERAACAGFSVQAHSTPLLTSSNILTLQRTLGNQALQRALEAQAQRIAQPSPSSVQRNILYASELENPGISTVFEQVLNNINNQSLERIRGDKYTYMIVGLGDVGSDNFGSTLFMLGGTALELFQNWGSVNKDTPVMLEIRLNSKKLTASTGVMNPNETLNTMIHEYALHVEPYLQVIDAIRAGRTGQDLAAFVSAKLQNELDEDLQHEGMVMQQNITYNAATQKAMEILWGLQQQATKAPWSLEAYQKDVQKDQYTQGALMYKRHIARQEATLLQKITQLSNNLGTIDQSQIAEVEAMLDEYKKILYYGFPMARHYPIISSHTRIFKVFE